MDYNLRVYKVGNRVVDGKKQVYNLLLVSEEALINESFKIQEPLDENPESIIIKLFAENSSDILEYIKAEVCIMDVIIITLSNLIEPFVFK